MTWQKLTLTTAALLLLVVLTAWLSTGTAEAWPPPSPCLDFVTGGGWFSPTPLGSDKANFGFEAGYKNTNQPLRGNLNYIDHNNGMHVKATSVDTYEAFSCTDFNGNECADRVFTGSAEVNGASGYSYTAEVIDDGEPGNVPKGHDRFRLSVSGPGLSYIADSGGAPAVGPTDGIDGGNIQIHKSCGANPK